MSIINLCFQEVINILCEKYYSYIIFNFILSEKLFLDRAYLMFQNNEKKINIMKI